MRTIVIGGSFDPVHIGHLLIAEEARCELGYERVVFVPAYRPPHKELSNEAGPGERLAMLRLATESLPECVVEDMEIRRGGVSYTVDTLAEIMQRYSVTGKPGFLLGDDLLPGFGAWREPERLADMADLIVAHRLHHDEVPFGFPHRYIENLMLPISSSDIRERIRAGRAFRHIVPDAVFGYIVTNMLYMQREQS